eukprot:TRINITY_DN37123_c0_g1_i1.p1 TRINITY_DN37123_c0_g1~~TRINITY_DN37123_c0_g1_i1.p1  ORF type:complete len:393 (-),score=109.20 TRINITY_DN37123_c0_g1_i1:132-1310(-)
MPSSDDSNPMGREGGVGAAGTSPPSSPPPPPPPGLRDGTNAEGSPGNGGAGGEDASVPRDGPAAETSTEQPQATNIDDLRSDVLSSIGEKVKRLLQNAKRDSEAKVKQELKTVTDAMKELDDGLDEMLAQLDQIEASPKQDIVGNAAVTKTLAKVEQSWGKELGKLKQELHQTIFAHNHNADLMKQQKEVLDQIRTRFEAYKNPAERLKVAKAQLAKVDMLKVGKSGTRIEPLFQRLAAIESRIATANSPAAAAAAAAVAAAAWQQWPGAAAAAAAAGTVPGGATLEDFNRAYAARLEATKDLEARQSARSAGGSKQAAVPPASAPPPRPAAPAGLGSEFSFRSAADDEEGLGGIKPNEALTSALAAALSAAAAKSAASAAPAGEEAGAGSQ